MRYHFKTFVFLMKMLKSKCHWLGPLHFLLMWWSHADMSQSTTDIHTGYMITNTQHCYVRGAVYDSQLNPPFFIFVTNFFFVLFPVQTFQQIIEVWKIFLAHFLIWRCNQTFGQSWLMLTFWKFSRVTYTTVLVSDHNPEKLFWGVIHKAMWCVVWPGIPS